jgi:hypothetical protein
VRASNSDISEDDIEDEEMQVEEQDKVTDTK